MGDLSSANIETRVMPGALHVEALKIAFGERAEAVRTKLLECIKVFVDLRDRYHLAVNFGTQRFSLAQAIGFRDRHEGKISIVCDIRRGEVKRAFWRRRPPLVPADTDAVVVDKTPAQITGNGEKRDGDEGQNQGPKRYFWIASCGTARSSTPAFLS